VCTSLGLLPMQRARRHWLALAFTLFEMAAPLIGIVAGRAALATVGAYGQIAAPAMLFGLPVTMSLDNLAAGLGISALACPLWAAALTIGMVSAAMSCMGIYGAAALRSRLPRWIPAHAEFAVGGYLCVLAARMIWAGPA
jgi:putative Mn2+ efflux pump MntP